MKPARLRDRLLLGSLALLPDALARHLLFLLRSHPALADRWGYHVRAIGYHDPLPDFRAITSAQAERRRMPAHVDFDWPGQLALIERLAARFGDEVRALAAPEGDERFDFANDYFAGFDAALYYALIRDLRPARVIEIGSGYSTRIADLALRRNRAEGQPGRLTCIEPYPQPRLTDARVDCELVRARVEDLDLALFGELAAGDILFIDSSHALRFGGDVCREYLEILPALAPGVWVHVHDIFFPQDYPHAWLTGPRLAFNEQYVLEAFLAFNREFEVRVAAHALRLDHAAAVSRLWAADGPAGASFWMARRLR